MPSRFVMTMMDNTSEKSVVTFEGVSMGAANFDAQVALQNSLASATNALSLGTHYKTARVASEAIISTAVPAVGVQREIKFLVRYHDNVTGKRLRLEIPCADLSLLVSGKEYVDPTSQAYTDFETAFEAYVLSEAGNAVVLDDIIFVTRNT